MIPFIDLKSQYAALKEGIQQRINTVLEHGQYVMGPEIEELEKVLAQYVGSKHCISCSSGTDAQWMALMALGIGPGDEVIIPDFSFFATVEVVELLRATPVFVDIDLKTYNLDPELLEKKITPKTKAIMPVSLYGQCADFDRINQIAKKHGVPVVEDAAQSFGAVYKGHRSCSLSKVGATSFFPSKPLGCYGDGGAIFTDDDDLALKLRMIRNHGQESRYVHVMVGINGRMDTLQAAILLEKMKILDRELEQRLEVAHRYNEKLKGVVGIPHVESHNQSAYAQYTIRVQNRDAFAKALQGKGVPTSVHYPGVLSAQPVFKGQYKPDCKNSALAAASVISLPMHPYLTAKQQDTIVEAVKSSL